MDRRVLVVVMAGGVLVAVLLAVLSLDDTTVEPARAAAPRAAPAPTEEAPDVPPAPPGAPTIPVADPDAPDDPDALTEDEREAHKQTAEAVLEGAVRHCLGPWAADQGLADDVVMVRVRAITTEDGLDYLSLYPPDEAPPEVADCLYETVGELGWPALPRFGELEETWRYHTIPGDGTETLEQARARVETARAEP